MRSTVLINQMMMLVLLLLLFVHIHTEHVSVNFSAEILQTELSSKKPRDFTRMQWELLSVRQVELHEAELSPVGSAGRNSTNRFSGAFMERFAKRYNYKDRVDVGCPMKPRGIAATCDWALLIPCLFGDLSEPPKTIFVHHLMLPHFVENILPQLPSAYRFVLVTSGTDQTIPTSRGDLRFQPLRGFAEIDGGEYWQTLTSHPSIIHWFCENHDLNHDKVSTLPTGLVGNPDGQNDFYNLIMTKPFKPIEYRPLKFLVTHRERTGTGQWADRRVVSSMCTEPIFHDSLCMTPPASMPKHGVKGIRHSHYLQLLSSVPFVVCVHGGGLDPSPKAWEAVLLGTIPIIHRTRTLDDAYAQLPVAFVDNWEELFRSVEVTANKLQQWSDLLSPYYSEPSKKRAVLHRLTTSYWQQQIEERYVDHQRRLSSHVGTNLSTAIAQLPKYLGLTWDMEVLKPATTTSMQL